MASRTEWRGQRDTTRSRLYRLLALSVLLHAPFTPLMALVGLMGLLLGKPHEEPPQADPVTAIPVDLVADEAPAPTAAPPVEGPPEPETVKPTDDPFKDLAKEDDGEPRVRAPRDAGAPAPDAAPQDAGPSIGDPVAMAGVAGKVVDSNANVRILIFADRMRNHPLGTRVGTLLGGAVQWQDFFGPTGLDPIKDVDRILIAGPQLRNSSDVVAVLRVNISQDKLHKAIDALVQRDPAGGWLDGGVPAARTHADRAERLIVLPAPQIVVVAPPSAEKHALSLGSNLKFPNPKGNEALTTFVVTPWRAFVGIPFEIPKSIKWVRMKIVATSDGGATAELVAEDESAESATTHAEELTRDINKVTQLKVGIAGFSLGSVSLLEPVAFKAVGKEIQGVVVATPKQLGALLEAVSGYAKQLAEEVERKRAAKAAADAGAVSGEGGAAPPSDAGKARQPDAAAPTHANDDEPRPQEKKLPAQGATPADAGAG